MADLSGVILDFATGVYTVTRSTARSNPYGTDGRLDAPSTSTLSVSACVQPVTGSDLQRLPEGLRSRRAVVVFTVEPLITASAGAEPDVVTIGGEPYQVEHVEEWSELGNYSRAIAVRKGR